MSNLTAADIEALERATVEAVAPPEVAEIGPWLVPLDDGTIGRAKSAVPLVHDTPERQASRNAQVAGSLALPDASPAANTEVELVDAAGKVVAKTRSTKNGVYRFRNVDADKQYQVRVKKDGYEAPAAPIAPAAAGETSVDLSLQRQ